MAGSFPGMMGPIVLLTDFGHGDSFVGVLKGVIHGIAPKAPVIDLCHGVPPQDIRRAALQLRASAPYFPKDALFVCVVDPGVGSERRIVWARTARHQFLAPDNGLLSWIEERALETRSVENRTLFLPRVSATFHGRDIFAPVAARLWKGLKPAALGPVLKSIERIPFPEPNTRGRRKVGTILAFDRYGNAITNLRATTKELFYKKKSLGVIRRSYEEGHAKDPFPVLGSDGLIEISLKFGDFRTKYNARVGDTIEF